MLSEKTKKKSTVTREKKNSQILLARFEFPTSLEKVASSSHCKNKKGETQLLQARLELTIIF